MFKNQNFYNFKFQFVTGNLVKVKDQIKKWAVSALEEDISSFFGTNASNIVIAMNEEIKELIGVKVGPYLSISHS